MQMSGVMDFLQKLVLDGTGISKEEPGNIYAINKQTDLFKDKMRSLVKDF